MAFYLGGWVNDEGVEIDERRYCGSCFPLGHDAQAKERFLLLCNLAGWRGEHLWHGKGSSRGYPDEELFAVLEDRRQGSDDYNGDDADAVDAMIKMSPAATDDELAQRYTDYSAECYAILHEPIVWSSIECVAAKLMERGKLSAADALEAIGGDAAKLHLSFPKIPSRPGFALQGRIIASLRAMFAILHALGMLIADLFRSCSRLEAENLLLRHQLTIALRRASPRLRLLGSDRALLIWMTRLWPSLLGAVQVVQPETILCWHRADSKRIGGGNRVIGQGGRRSIAACAI